MLYLAVFFIILQNLGEYFLYPWYYFVHLMLLAANFRPYHPLGAHFRGNNHYIRAPIYSCLQDLQIEKGEISFSVPFASGPGSSKLTHEHLRMYNK